MADNDITPMTAADFPEGTIDDAGQWVFRPDPATMPVLPEEPHEKTLQDWLDEYPYDKNPHPYIHMVKAIPMGVGDQPPMNHALEVLNLMAIHLARLDATFGDNPEIHYAPPEHGPNVAYNPGTWVSINEAVTERPAEPVLDLTGVPADQLQLLEDAVKRAKAQAAMAAAADPLARDAALIELAAAPTMNVVVTPANEPEADK